MSKKKHTLIVESSTEYLAIGIASTESEFQLSLLLNSFLSIKLTTASPIQKIIKTENISFPCFKYDNDENLQVVIAKNKLKGIFLFQNQQSFDFIIIVSGSDAVKNASLIEKELKKQENVSLVSEIEIKKLVNFKSLLPA